MFICSAALRFGVHPGVVDFYVCSKEWIPLTSIHAHTRCGSTKLRPLVSNSALEMNFVANWTGLDDRHLRRLFGKCHSPFFPAFSFERGSDGFISRTFTHMRIDSCTTPKTKFEHSSILIEERDGYFGTITSSSAIVILDDRGRVVQPVRWLDGPEDPRAFHWKGAYT
jgi:hypothetical protein